jgi:hypothetical protein
MIIKMTNRLYGPVNNISGCYIFSGILPLIMGDLNGVYPIESKNLHKIILPPV